MAFRRALLERGAAAATVNLRLAALRKLAREAVARGWVARDLCLAIETVENVRRRGRRTGNWLSKAQTERLLRTPDRSTVRGRRDAALLRLLVGCGLRREEAAALDWAQVQMRESRWVLIDVLGKGNVLRTVPMPNWGATALRLAAGPTLPSEGRVFRQIDRHGRVLGPLGARAIADIVHERGKEAGLNITAHDLRRTFAHLAERGRAPLKQIQKSLGHLSIETTQVYLGDDQDLVEAPCDVLGLDLED